MADAIFVPDGDRFAPTAAAGSPWADGLLHGGPPMGLLARAIERLNADPVMTLVRLTVDLLRPVPAVPLLPSVTTVRMGKRLHVVQASLLADGIEVSHATGLLLRRTDVPTPHSSGLKPTGPEGIDTTPLGRGSRGSGRPGFHTTVEARWVSQPGDEQLPTTWIRVPLPLVRGEPLSTLVRVAATADFVNAVGSVGIGGPVGYINADCSLYLHREAAGEWIGLRVERRVEPTGLGASHATLFDALGPIGFATQAVLANRMDERTEAPHTATA